MLEEKRRKLFWTPCATHCIDQMLEDFLKIKCVGECMEKGQKDHKVHLQPDLVVKSYEE
jgi:hypothetical protein